MADVKVTALDALATPADADILLIVDDVAGTPISKKVTRAHLLTVGNAEVKGTKVSTDAAVARLEATAATIAAAGTDLNINITLTPKGTGIITTAAGVAAGGALTAGSLGYKTGVGGAVTQATSKVTAVTLNKICGAITMHNAELAAGVAATFTLTNSTIAATDVVVVSIKSGATDGKYHVTVGATAAGSCKITLHNYSAGALSEAVILNFAVIKAALD